MSHFVPFELMILFRVKAIIIPNLVMTEAASVELALADRVWTLQLALSQVMFAAKIFFFVRLIIIHVFNFFLLTLSTFTAPG